MMKTVVATALIAGLSLSGQASGHGFEAFLASYRAAPPDAREPLLAELIERQQEADGFPIVSEEGAAVFLYQAGSGVDEIRLVGDFRTKSFYNIYWDETGESMERAAPGGDLFWARLAVEPDARLDYAFVVDGERTPDPLNPRTIFSGAGGGEVVSELVMPGYRLDPALEPGVTQVPHDQPVPGDERVPGDATSRGSVHLVEEPWATPRVRVYLPPGYDPARRYPTVYTADGSAWLELLGFPAILDALIVAGRIEPVIAVMVDAAADRAVWHYYHADFLSYLERVVTHVDARFSTRARADQRLHVGTSSGGRASLFAALERPELIGKAGALSPPLDGPISYWLPYLSGDRRPAPGLELWMSAGTYEGVIPEGVATLAALFGGWGLPVATVLTHEGHSFGTWRNLIPRLLEHYFPAPLEAARKSGGDRAGPSASPETHGG